MRSIEIRFVTRPENTVRRCVGALFSPKMLRAGAVKGLIVYFLPFLSRRLSVSLPFFALLFRSEPASNLDLAFLVV